MGEWYEPPELREKRSRDDVYNDLQSHQERKFAQGGVIPPSRTGAPAFTYHEVFEPQTVRDRLESSKKALDYIQKTIEKMRDLTI